MYLSIICMVFVCSRASWLSVITALSVVVVHVRCWLWARRSLLLPSQFLLVHMLWLSIYIHRLNLQSHHTTPCFIKNDPYLIAPNFGKCWPILKNFHPRTQQRCVMNWSLKVHHTLKMSIHYLVKCKCQETTDNLKQISHLTINFNLIYYS